MQDQINVFVVAHPEWQFERDQLVGNWQFENFTKLRLIVSDLCGLADELDHHPTVTYGYNSLRIETTTHDAGDTVTELDLTLAKRVSEMVGE